MEITAYRLAKDIDVPVNRITDIVNEERAISADTALRLGRYFGTSAKIWAGLQADYDLEIAATKAAQHSLVLPRSASNVLDRVFTDLP